MGFMKNAGQDPGAVIAATAAQGKAPGKSPAEGTQSNMSPQQIEQHLTGAGMRRQRNEVEDGDEEAQGAPPPKPTTRVISSGQAVEPNDLNMVEAPVSPAGAPDAVARSYAKAAMEGAGASANGVAPKLSKTAEKLKQRRLWLGKGKAPATPRSTSRRDGGLLGLGK